MRLGLTAASTECFDGRGGPAGLENGRGCTLTFLLVFGLCALPQKGNSGLEKVLFTFSN